MNQTSIDVLLVDDSMDDAGLALRALRQKNAAMKVKHLQDGQDALDFLFSETGPNLPKLIILDLKMPRVSGFDVLRRVRADPRLRLTPVVVLSSSREDRDIMESYDLGVNAYIVKPVSYQEFTAAINDLGTFWMSRNEFPTM